MEKQFIYVQEVLTQLRFAQRCFAGFDEALTRGDVESVFFELHHAVIHIANVDKLLEAKHLSSRFPVLVTRLDLVDLDLKMFRRLRNHLEHFDERLDDWMARFDGHAFFDMNIVTGASGFPDKAFLRALAGDVFKFYGEDYPLEPLRNAVDDIYKKFEEIGQ